jgi:hypothetical protein
MNTRNEYKRKTSVEYVKNGGCAGKVIFFLLQQCVVLSVNHYNFIKSIVLGDLK